MNQKDNKYKIVNHCDCCNFDAHSQTEWTKHINTKKHSRNGQKIADNLKCEQCGLVSYNFNIHMILIHGTTEDKQNKAKFYCQCYDVVFFVNYILINIMHPTNI